MLNFLGGSRGSAGALTRPSTRHLLPKNFEKTALRKRGGIFAVKMGGGGIIAEITVHCMQLCLCGVNLIGIPGSLAARTSVSPLSSKAPTRNTRTKFKRNTTTREGGIHKYQNTGR